MRPAAKLSSDAEDILDGLASHIDALLDGQYTQMLAHHWMPAAESPLEHVRQGLLKQFGPGGDWDGAEAERAGRLGTLMLAVSGQHLEAMRALILARQVVFPIAPLARSILEAAGRTFWLTDPKLVGPRNWAARVWMARLEDITRRVTTAKGLQNQKVLEELVKRKQRLRRSDVPSRFYPSEIENRDGVITLCGQHPPGLSGSLKHVAAGMGVEDFHTGMYAYLSDLTHPTSYAALEALQPAKDGDLHSFGSGDLRREYLIIRTALIAYQQAWYVLTTFFGLDSAEVARISDGIDSVPMPPGIDNLS